MSFHERSLAADTAPGHNTGDSTDPSSGSADRDYVGPPCNRTTIAAHIGNADVHTAESTLYPVETTLLARPSSAPIYTQAAAAVIAFSA